jgi:hypothetical protein
MLKLNPILVSVAALLIASLACAGPVVSVSTPDANVIGTMIAQTVVVAATQTSQGLIPITGAESPTFTPELPTLSPTSTLSPTPVFTSTPVVPLISVSVATNCRVGPGRVYDRVGALLVGEVAEVFGVNPTGNYWYIRNPNSSTGFCWLWGEYATLAGNVSALPVYTPPPTPTPPPDFTVRFAGLETCAPTTWWVDFRLENSGGVTFRSISITVRDASTNVTLSMWANEFTIVNGCPGSNTRNVLEPGDRLAVSMSPFSYDPTGHDLRATITLCSNTDIAGLCTSETIVFKP